MTEWFLQPKYITERKSVRSEYIRQMQSYILRRHPNINPERLSVALAKVCDKKFVNPQVEIIDHPTPGNSERKTVPLTQYMNRNIATNIIAPAGVVYCLPTVKESFLKVSLYQKLKERKVYKTKMLQAQAIGDILEGETQNYLQASTKIFINSAPGAMNSAFNCLYDLPGYNAVTSISRQSVKCGYGTTERVVEGNLYFPDLGSVISYCSRITDTMPKQFGKILTDHGLRFPTRREVAEHLYESAQYYIPDVTVGAIEQTALVGYDIVQTAFIFYAGCLKNLVTYNDHVFRPFFDDLFNLDVPWDRHVDPKKVFSYENDLVTMIASLDYEILGIDPDTNVWNDLVTAQKHNPDGVRRLIGIIDHYEAKMASMGDVWKAVFQLQTDLSNIHAHPNMIRRCVIVSDTDSVIFSTKTMTQWYARAVDFSRKSYEMNAFTVYVISRTLEHSFSRLSCGFGMIGEDIKKILMKNEFLYPIMLCTPLRKHYVAIATRQEGKLLATPKKDTKGLQFKSSTLPVITNKAVESFLYDDILNKYMADGKLSLANLLKSVARFEGMIYKSLMNGEKTFLQTVSVKDATEYKDPSRSSYFLYDLWEKVFVPTFDTIVLPNKCFKIPIADKGRMIFSPGYLEKVRAFDESMYDRLANWMSTNNRKKLTMLLVAPTMATIPEILRPLIDTRSIIAQNCKGMYLALESLGVGATYSKDLYLVSDFIDDEILQEIASEETTRLAA